MRCPSAGPASASMKAAHGARHTGLIRSRFERVLLIEACLPFLNPLGRSRDLDGRALADPRAARTWFADPRIGAAR